MHDGQKLGHALREQTLLQVPLAWSSSHVTAPKTGQADAGLDLGSVGSALAIAGTALGAYHGFKRNNSVGWAVLWGLLGGAFPVIVIPVAFAQGFSKRAK